MKQTILPHIRGTLIVMTIEMDEAPQINSSTRYIPDGYVSVPGKEHLQAGPFVIVRGPELVPEGQSREVDMWVGQFPSISNFLTLGGYSRITSHMYT